jgi:mannosyltransferase
MAAASSAGIAATVSAEGQAHLGGVTRTVGDLTGQARPTRDGGGESGDPASHPVWWEALDEMFSTVSGLPAYRRSVPTLLNPTSAPGAVGPAALPEPAAARRWLPVAGPGVAMLALGLLGSTRSVLSWDEVATADVAHRSVPQIGNMAHHIDAVLSPYYLAMHVWTSAFGDSVLSLRLPSILAMAAAAALTGELGRRLLGSAAGAVAGFLLCLLPNISRYAAEARPYAWVCLMSILALLLLYRALEHPGVGRWAAYAAAVVGLGLGSLVAMAALTGHAALLISRLGRERPNRRSVTVAWSVAVVGTLVLLSPLMWWGLQQRRAQLHWVPPMTPGAVYTFPKYLIGSTEVAWLLIGLLLVAAYRPTRPMAEMLAAAGVPLFVVCAVSFAGASFWVNRYLLFVLLPAVIATAAGLTRVAADGPLRSTVSPLAATLAVFAAAAVPGQIAVRQPTFKNGSDYRTLAAVIVGRQQPGDDIVLEKGRTMRAGLDYYLRHDAGRPRDVLLREPAAVTATLTAAEYDDPVARLASATRIWLVAYGRRSDPGTARPDLRQLLHNGYRRIGLWEVKDGSMALYVMRP